MYIRASSNRNAKKWWMDRKISSDTSEVNSISSMLFRLLFAFDNIHFPLPHELSILWKVSGRKFDESSFFFESVKRFSVKKAINYVRSIKVLELKVYILSCLFTSPVARFLSDFLWFEKKRNACPALGLNPGPLACEASVLTILPLPLLIKTLKIREYIQLCLHSRRPDFCQKWNMQLFASSTLTNLFLELQVYCEEWRQKLNPQSN